MEKLQSVLLRLAAALNKQHIPWALGASMLLYYHKIVSSVNDLDIMILEEDEQKVKDILSSMGTIKSNKIDQSYATKVFMEVKIEGVDIDVIGGFTIKTEDEYYYCPLQLEKITSIKIEGVTVYLDDVSLWEKYYQLMGRTERVSAINTALKMK